MACVAHFEAQPTKARMVILRQGQKVRVVGPVDPLHVRFVPLEYDELHACMVPEDIRRTPGYAGYDMIGAIEWFYELFQPCTNEA